MVTNRPHLVNLKWYSGGSYVNGRLANGTLNERNVYCRVRQTVGQVIEMDGRKLEVKYRVITDLTTILESVNEGTMTMTYNGVTHKVAKIVRLQTFTLLIV